MENFIFCAVSFLVTDYLAINWNVYLECFLLQQENKIYRKRRNLLKVLL